MTHEDRGFGAELGEIVGNYLLSLEMNPVFWPE
jgi:hypothetical protein